MADNIYYELEERGHGYLYHWIILMLGGLRKLPDMGYPIKIYINNLKDQGYHGESLDLIKDKYIFEKPKDGSIVIKNYGEDLITPDRVDTAAYIFLRELYLSRLPKIDHIKGRYYITRKNCEKANPANNGCVRRQVLNEDEVYPFLKENGFEILQFEDYSFKNKINFFQSAEIIISPSSGALTFATFANEKTKIVEILPRGIPDADHYQILCNELKIPFYRFSDLTTVGPAPTLHSAYNMIVDTHNFNTFIMNILNN